MFIIRYKKLFFILSGVLFATAVFSVVLLGLNIGIDFTGGSTLEVSYEDDKPTQSEVEESIRGMFDRQISVREAGENNYIIQTPFIKGDLHSEILNSLSFDGQHSVNEERFSSVGPVIGSELARKAFVAMSIVVVAIIIFVAFIFRRGEDKEGNILRGGVSSWLYGVSAVIALIFDVLIPTGLFAILGVMIGAEVDILFVTALLAILGFSVNDTIVVFDRVRENLHHNYENGIKKSFADTVGSSLEQSYARSINTSFTTAVVLLALYIFGGQVTQAFALTLLVGVLAGTYSSLFLASPLLVWFQERFDAKSNSQQS